MIKLIAVPFSVYICTQQAMIARDTKSDPIAQRNASFTPLHDVWKFISELGISKVCLNRSDKVHI
jgi:hypothetical protein